MGWLCSSGPCSAEQRRPCLLVVAGERGPAAACTCCRVAHAPCITLPRCLLPVVKPEPTACPWPQMEKLLQVADELGGPEAVFKVCAGGYAAWALQHLHYLAPAVRGLPSCWPQQLPGRVCACAALAMIGTRALAAQHPAACACPALLECVRCCSERLAPCLPARPRWCCRLQCCDLQSWRRWWSSLGASRSGAR